jgi:sec-independent protein translocase protein TatB
VFGLGFGEVVLLIIVAIVVVGPRQLPSMMRAAGQWVSRIRRMSTDLRAQSGIDQLMRDEGIDRSIQELRSLSNINVLDGLERIAQAPAVTPGAPTARPPLPAADAANPTTSTSETKPELAPTERVAGTVSSDKPAEDKPADPAEKKPNQSLREREYPVEGCDSYGALPEEPEPYGAVATVDPIKAHFARRLKSSEPGGSGAS